MVAAEEVAVPVPAGVVLVVVDKEVEAAETECPAILSAV